MIFSPLPSAISSLQPAESACSAYNQHRGALRGIPGSACPQPEPNTTELPNCTPISARAVQRRRRRRWWRGAARAPNAESFAKSCGTSSATRSPRPSPRLSRAFPSRVAQGQRGGRYTCVGRGFRCWEMARATTNNFTLPSSAAFARSSFTGFLRGAARVFWAWVPPLEDGDC